MLLKEIPLNPQRDFFVKKPPKEDYFATLLFFHRPYMEQQINPT
jgi:hypothetical protein